MKRFIIMHKTNAQWERGAAPDQALIDRVGALMGELAASGLLLAGEGLRPSSEGARLQFSGGQRTVSPGPFKGDSELPATFSIVRTASLEDAVDWATRQTEVLGDGETDIRPVTEAWDIGIAPRPSEIATRRYMVLRKATRETEAGTAPSPETSSRLSQLIEETTRAGVHLATETLQPSRKGRRFTNSRQGVSFYDGPFAETKELLGGYVIISAQSLDEASKWARRYIDVVNAEEVDVRELY